jgi:plasmid stabilization system protein ParE
MVEIPRAMIVERIRDRSGPEAADSANDELPDKLDLDSDADARLLRRYDIEPDELREEFGGGSPSTG